MALSNMLVEPRREIIETVAGLLAMAIPFGWIYYLAKGLQASDRNPEPLLLCLFIATVMTAFICAAVGGLMLLTHWVGERVCEWLRDRGMEIRPTQRYRRDLDGNIVPTR